MGPMAWVWIVLLVVGVTLLGYTAVRVLGGGLTENAHGLLLRVRVRVRVNLAEGAHGLLLLPGSWLGTRL